ncbi:MAG TPA: hypothetical protein VLF66_20380 [Thermoanaerobaculia bacterium]|nr:hypothetical protein [Thermoanaerobaculia bacterium]
MELDDRKRGKTAVGVSLRETDDGQLRISFDDLERAQSTDLPEWRMWSFYTHFDLPKDQVLEHGLTDEQYARIGQTLMARLAALWRNG